MEDVRRKIFCISACFILVFSLPLQVVNQQTIKQMTEKEKQNSEEKPFVVRSYTKIELALLYCPGREPATALQSLYRWMRKCAPLRTELQQYGYDKHRHSFLKREVEIIRKHLGDP